MSLPRENDKPEASALGQASNVNTGATPAPVFQHVAYSTIDPFSTIKRLIKPQQISSWVKDLQRVCRLMGLEESVMIERYAALMSDEPYSSYIEKYVTATHFSGLKESLCSAFLDKISPAEKLQHIMQVRQENNEPVVRFFMRINAEFESYSSLVKNVPGSESLLPGINLLKQQAFEQGLHENIRRFIREKGLCADITEVFQRAKLYEEINGICSGMASLSAAVSTPSHNLSGRGSRYEPRRGRFLNNRANFHRGRGGYIPPNNGSYVDPPHRGNFRGINSRNFRSSYSNRGNRGPNQSGYSRRGNFYNSFNSQESTHGYQGANPIPIQTTNANASTSVSNNPDIQPRRSVFCVICKTDNHHTYNCEIVKKGRQAIQAENTEQGN